MDLNLLTRLRKLRHSQLGLLSLRRGTNFSAGKSCRALRWRRSAHWRGWWLVWVSISLEGCKSHSVNLSALGLIKCIRDFVPFYTLLSIFIGLVKPQFDYCSLVWDCCSTSLAEKLQKLQNLAARILLSAPYDSSATDLFRRLHWKNLRNQRLFAKAIMMFKILNGETPDYLQF